MNAMTEWYNPDITSASYKELNKFTHWCNKIFGYYPIIIGGWAVYYYTNQAQSRDIDLILPTNQDIHQLLLPYYAANQYKSAGLITKEYYKEVQTKNGTDKIYLDASSYQRKNQLKENSNIELAWNLLEKNAQEWKTTKFTARVPLPELLLLYKVKAFRDRTFDLKTTQSLGRKTYLTAKIEKDTADIQGLQKLKLNKDKLEQLLQQTKFKKYYNPTILELEKK